MTGYKKIVSLMIGVFIVSGISSAATWFVLSQKQGKEPSWKETLSLTSEQSKKFTQLESDLNSVLKEMDMDEAKNKIFLCSYLYSANRGSDRMKSITVKMAETYRKKQEKIAAALTALSEILTPEQNKTFSRKLMHEVCVSCRNSTGNEKCLCGMCGV